MSPSGEPLHLPRKCSPFWELDPLTKMNPFLPSHLNSSLEYSKSTPPLLHVSTLSGIQAKDAPERGGDPQGVSDKVRIRQQATNFQLSVGLDMKAI